ncbi:MAG: transglutaminase-like domain-containing protein [Promethearchaeota archaeon]
MRNKLLIPLIVVSICGTIGLGTFSGLFIVKQVQYTSLKSDFEDLNDNFTLREDEIAYLLNEIEILLRSLSNVTEVLEEQIIKYEILLGNNTLLQNELNDLQNQYDNLTASYNELLDDYNDLQEDFGSLLDKYNALSNDYDYLLMSYAELQDAYDLLSTAYDDLVVIYNNLQDDYINLMDDYNDLEVLCEYYQNLYIETQNNLDMFLEFIINELPMAQKMAFYYQFVRNAEPKWQTYNEMLIFAEKIILHSTQEYNPFSNVDVILNEFNFFEKDSMTDNNETISNVFANFYPYWNTAANLQMIQDWITDNLDYIYDSNTTWNRNYDNDFFQSPLETFMYRGGDCDDYAIISCAMFEKQGWETAIAGISDPNHGLYGSFSHAFLFVNVGESAYPSTVHWHLGGGPEGYPWIPVDTLWCETIGETPAWLQWYYDYGDETWIADHITIEIIDGVF